MSRQPMARDSAIGMAVATQPRSASLRGKIIGIYTILITFNVVVWGFVLTSERRTYCRMPSWR